MTFSGIKRFIFSIWNNGKNEVGEKLIFVDDFIKELTKKYSKYPEPIIFFNKDEDYYKNIKEEIKKSKNIYLTSDEKYANLCRNIIKPYISNGDFDSAFDIVEEFYKNIQSYSNKEEEILEEIEKLENEKKRKLF